MSERLRVDCVLHGGRAIRSRTFAARERPLRIGAVCGHCRALLELWKGEPAPFPLTSPATRAAAAARDAGRLDVAELGER